MAAYKDYYQILGVSKNATHKEIRAAYRKLAAKHHPDKHKGDKAAEEKFKEIGEAYAVLSDEEKRAFYDQYGATAGQGGFPPGDYQNFQDYGTQGGNFQGFNVQGGDFSDFFQTLFGGYASSSGGGFQGGFQTGGRTATSNPFGFQAEAEPQPLRAEVSIDPRDAYQGSKLNVTLQGKRLEVTVPKGSNNGTRLRLRGQGPEGRDVVLKLRFDPKATFKIDGDDVRVTVEVPDYVAVLGGAVRVSTLDGEVDMTIPAKTKTGKSFRLRGQGWPKRKGGRGDQFAEVRVVTPEHPSEEEIKLYEQLRALHQEPAKI